MCYYGSALHLDCDRLDHRDDITVKQQPFDGNALMVYNGKLLPGGQIQFSDYY